MNTLLNNVVSLFKQGVGRVAIGATWNATDEIVAGYSYSPSLCNEVWRRSSGHFNRRQVGILYADIANYTRLTEQDEDGTHRRLVKSLKSIKTHIAANGGRATHFAGDAVLAEFKDADSALHCAINVQLAARQWNANINFEQQVLFRIGVNFGNVISDQGDIYGNAVNLAARLEQLACSGGICVSEAVQRELEDHQAFKFVALGKRYVKNIREPVRAFWIEIDAHHVVNPGLTSVVKTSAVAS